MESKELEDLPRQLEMLGAVYQEAEERLGAVLEGKIELFEDLDGLFEPKDLLVLLLVLARGNVEQQPREVDVDLLAKVAGLDGL